MGIDRGTDEKRAEILLDFVSFLLTEDVQQSLNALGMFSVSESVRNTPPESGLKEVFKAYETIRTVDPFQWESAYDELISDASLARKGDAQAHNRFTNRLHELYR